MVDITQATPMPDDQPEIVRTRPRLGELLVSMGLVAQEDIEAALAAQRDRAEPLGQVLVGLGTITPVELTRALAAHHGFDFVDLDAIVPEPSAVITLREPFCRRRGALAYRWSDGSLAVAMANPSDVFTLDDIRSLTGAELRTALAEPAQLSRAIDRAFRAGSGAEAILQLASEQLVDDSPVEAPVAAAATGDAPVIAFVDQLLTRAIGDRASDVHLEPAEGDMRVRFRIDGVLHDVMNVPRRLQAAVISRVKVMADIDIAERRLPQDGRVSASLAGRPVDLRVATLPTANGEAIILRILDRAGGLLGLDDLGFARDTIGRWKAGAAKTDGAMLVTGPTGSGKSTTLDATLSLLYDPRRSLISVEDPVEYRMGGVKQIQVNRRAGLTFASALRSILRADPDIVLVGEIRDPETARIAIEAALTGHLVLSSLHTNDAASAPVRLVDMGVDPYLVTSSVHAVMGQRLVRRLCDACRAPADTTEAALEAAAWPDEEVPPEVLWKAVGCPACAATGYRGRFAVQEVLTMSPAIAKLILAEASSDEVEAQACAEGMRTMRRDGLDKVLAGETTLEELLRVVN